MQVQLLQMIQQKWRCHVYSTRSRRKALILETDKGLLFIKNYLSQEKAEWVVSLSKQLAQKGFTQTLEYTSAKEGQFVVPFNGRHWVMIKQIKGRDAQYENLYDVLQTVRCLGNITAMQRELAGGHYQRLNRCLF